MQKAPRIGLMVPLHEEYHEIRKLLPCSRSYRARSETFYELTTKGGAAILAAVVGEMAQESAALVAERLVEEGAELLAVVGIAGATSSDVRLGDVVAANLVDLYRNGAKAVPAGEAGFSLQLAGSSYRVPWHVVQALRDFKERPELKDAWLGWQERAAQRRAALGLDHAEALRLTRAQPDLLVGHIASGTDVAASQAFVDWLKQRDRSYLAIEMESGGVSASAHRRVQEIPLVVLRGVSDFADERKADLDRSSEFWPDGSWRRLAVQNAIDLLSTLMDAGQLDLREQDGDARDEDMTRLRFRPVEVWLPEQLGVHPAISGEGSGSTTKFVLPTYIPREHDDAVASTLTEFAATGNSGMVLVRGSSCSGKTRTAFEATQHSIPKWNLFAPRDTAALLSALGSNRLSSRTVVWLDDIHDYLEHESAETAAAALLDQLDNQTHLIVVATTWPDRYESLSDATGRGTSGPQVRKLFKRARRVDVPEHFSLVLLRELPRPAKYDPSLREAREAALNSGRLCQTLAAGPDLVDHWRNGPDPYGRALIDAAVDAHRHRVRDPLPSLSCAMRRSDT